MSQEGNIEVVRAAIDAVNRGDLDAALEYTAPGFVWDNSAALGEWRGVYTTPEEIKRVWAFSANLWESMRFNIDALIPAGAHVVVPHTTLVRGRDGIEVEAHTTWLFTLSGGKIEHMCLYQDRVEAPKAAGLSE